MVRAQKKREKRDLLNLKAKERNEAIDAVVRINVASAVLYMSETEIHEQFKKWKASHRFLLLNDAMWQTHFNAALTDLNDEEAFDELCSLHEDLIEQLTSVPFG